MDLSKALQLEIQRVLPVVQSTLTFSITFRAAEELLNDRFDKGLFLIFTCLAALLLLLGLQVKCQNCLLIYATEWWAAVFILLHTLLETAGQMAIAFTSNLIANSLVAVLVTAVSPEWVVWWSAVGLGFVAIGFKMLQANAN